MASGGNTKNESREKQRKKKLGPITCAAAVKTGRSFENKKGFGR